MPLYIVPSFYPDGPDNAPADAYESNGDKPTHFIVYDDAIEFDARIVKVFDNEKEADNFIAFSGAFMKRPKD